MSMIKASERISGLLRAVIADPNTSRTANWIYPDKPRLIQISNNKDNFPRVGIVEAGGPHSIGSVGIGATETEDEVTLAVNVYAIKDALMTVNTIEDTFTYQGEETFITTDEPITTASVVGTLGGQQDYPFIKGQDYILIDNNGDGRYDGISWKEGGDVPDLGTDFTITALRQLSHDDLTKYLAHTIHKYLRDNWREATVPYLFDYQKLESNTVEELDGLISRTEMRIKFSGMNIGD